MKHVDDFIADYESDAYAAFVFHYFRLSAVLKATLLVVHGESPAFLYVRREAVSGNRCIAHG
jgi:hypothetical protein